MIQLDNLGAVIYTCIVATLYLGAVGICRTVIFSTILKVDDRVINSVSFGIFSLIFLFGPFSMPLFHKIIRKFTYRAVFFTTSVANVLSIALYVFTVEQQPADGYLITLILIFEMIAAPFMALFYCTYNFYIRGMANKENIGIYFGIAYSIFYMQNFIGDIYVAFETKIYAYNQYFYYPMLAISLLLTTLYWFIREPNINSQSQTCQSINLEEKITHYLYGSLMDDEDGNQNSQNNYSYANQLKEIWKVPQNLPGFRYMIPTMISNGLISAFCVICSQSMIEINSSYMIMEPKLIRSLSAHGVGEFLGGIMIGFLSDIFGQVTLLLWIQIFSIAVFIVIFGEYDEIQNQKTGLIYTFNFLSGFLISSIQTTTFSYCGAWFTQNKNAMQLCNWIYCLSFYVFAILMSLPQLPGQPPNYEPLMISISSISGFVIVFCILNFVCLWFYRRKVLQINQEE